MRRLSRRGLVAGLAGTAVVIAAPRLARAQPGPAPAGGQTVIPAGNATGRPLATQLAQLSAKQSHLRCWKPLGGTLGAVPGGSYTYGITVELESDFDAVRLLFGNDTQTTWDVTAASVAASSKWGGTQGFLAIAADGTSAGHWFSVTFDTTVAGVVLPNGTTRTATVPVPPVIAWSGQSDAQTFAASNWIPCASVPRVDGGTRPLLTMRIGVGADCRGYQSNATWLGFASITGAPQVRNGLLSGDMFTTPTAADGFDASAVAWNQIPIWAIEYRSRARGVTLLIAGDSMYQGTSTTTQNASCFQRAAWALSTNASPISAVNAAIGGSASPVFDDVALAMVRELLPSIVIVPAKSTNDAFAFGPAEAANAILNMDMGRAMGLALADEVTRYGGIPILCTTPPRNDADSAQVAAYVDSIAKLKAAISGGPILLFDSYALMANGAGQYANGAWTTDGVHPNDAGTAVLLAAFQPMLAALI